MRSPSSRVLADRVDIYAARTTVDAVKAPSYSYPATPTRAGVACSIQAHAVEEVVDEQMRVTQERHFTVMFGSPTGLKPRDKVVFRDRSGATRTLFVHVERDEAGRGSAFTVRCIEKSLI